MNLNDQLSEVIPFQLFVCGLLQSFVVNVCTLRILGR